MWAEQAARHLAIFYDCHLDVKRAAVRFGGWRFSISGTPTLRQSEFENATTYRLETRQVDINLGGAETCNDASDDDSFGLRPGLAERQLKFRI